MARNRKITNIVLGSTPNTGLTATFRRRPYVDRPSRRWIVHTDETAQRLWDIAHHPKTKVTDVMPRGTGLWVCIDVSQLQGLVEK